MDTTPIHNKTPYPQPDQGMSIQTQLPVEN